MRSFASAVAGLIRNTASQMPIPLSTAAAGMTSLFAGDTAGKATQLLGSAEKSGTLFAVIDRICTNFSRVKWHLYREAPSGLEADRTEVTKHASINLFRNPNPWMTEAEFEEATQQYKELSGEQWWVIARSPLSPIPLELYVIRPDRMRPVPGVKQFIVGYEYTSPDGQIIPLGLDDVIYSHSPNPLDPYRGLSPVASMLVRLDMVDLATRWNRAFFANSADAGGVITVNRKLTDDEWRTAQRRWAEAHRGVNAAHRVAIIEGQDMGWQPNQITQRDMQFLELDIRGRDVVYEAYGISSATMGVIDNANRAVAEAGRAMFAELLTDPRCSHHRDVINYRLMPKYGTATTRGLVWDYDSPIPADRAADDAERTSIAAAALAMNQAGYDPDAILKWLGLPPMEHTGVVTVGAPPPTAPGTAPAEPASPAVEPDDSQTKDGA